MSDYINGVQLIQYHMVTQSNHPSDQDPPSDESASQARQETLKHMLQLQTRPLQQSQWFQNSVESPLAHTDDLRQRSEQQLPHKIPKIVILPKLDPKLDSKADLQFQKQLDVQSKVLFQECLQDDCTNKHQQKSKIEMILTPNVEMRRARPDTCKMRSQSVRFYQSARPRAASSQQKRLRGQKMNCPSIRNELIVDSKSAQQFVSDTKLLRKLVEPSSTFVRPPTSKTCDIVFKQYLSPKRAFTPLNMQKARSRLEALRRSRKN